MLTFLIAAALGAGCQQSALTPEDKDRDQRTGVVRATGASPSPTASDSATTDGVEVTTVEARDAGGGKVVGSFSAQGSNIQLLAAPLDSPVAGASIAFPPGTLAVDTEVAIGPGASVATPAAVGELAGAGNSISSAGLPVLVQPSIAIDPSKPFTVSLPIPDDGLSLADRNDLLVVFYRVQKADGTTLSGIIVRSGITLANATASFTAQFFGTFQAVYLALPVAKPKELAAAVIDEKDAKIAEAAKPVETPPAEVKPAKRVSRYYAAGALVTVRGTAAAGQPQLVAWGATVVPSTSKNGNARSATAYSLHTSEED